jgi:hypothetical protein
MSHTQSGGSNGHKGLRRTVRLEVRNLSRGLLGLRLGIDEEEASSLFL